ncbi:MAG: lysylphosphatidylglycerol synthase transmembrane domain-containing protein [Pirellulaceae bacterium]
MKRIIIQVCKYAVSFSLLAYLFYSASRNDSFRDLIDQPKHWGLLVIALLVTMAATMLSMVRWYLLVRALDLPFTLRDAFRLGFLGYMFNFFSFGVVGGDLLKAVTIARQQPERRAEAMATVFIDRAVGLYALFILVTCGFLWINATGFEVGSETVSSAIDRLSQVAIGVTAVGAVAGCVILSPGFTRNPLSRAATRLPVIGGVVERLLGAAEMYRRRIPLLMVAMGMSVLVHCMSAVSIYLLASGLPGPAPSFATHFVIVPIATVAAAVPLPGGLGAFEMALNLLYRNAMGAATVGSKGFVVALAALVIKLLIAAVGMVMYLASRKRIEDLMHETPGELTPESANEPAPILAPAPSRLVDSPAPAAARRVA